MRWEKLGQSGRGMWCASEGCWGIPAHRLEVDGVGSNYCTECRADIEAATAAIAERGHITLDQLKAKLQN